MDWDKVETNFELMNLHTSTLNDKEKEYVGGVIKEPINSLQTGAFLRMLELDGIEGITKNTEAWLENFRGLTTFKKK